MKFDSSIKTISILVIMICLLNSSAFAKLMPTWPIEYSLETQDQLVVGDMIHFSFGITPKHVSCDEITVSVETVSGLTYFGETYWTVPFRDKIETNYSFDVIIPDNDTCGLKITLSCGDYSNTINRYFITTSDSVQMIRSMPRTYPEGFLRPKFEGRIGNVIPGEFPEDDSLYGIPENPTLIDYERDSSYQMTKEEAQLRRMHWLEQKPLTDKDREDVFVGNVRYIRYRGEYEFTSANEKLGAELQSMKDNPPDNDYDVIFDLTKKDDYNFVNQLVDSLVPDPDSLSYYRTVIKRNILIQILNKGIKYQTYRRFIDRKNREPNQPPLSKKK